MSQADRLDSVDGLRGLAVFMVVFGHSIEYALPHRTHDPIFIASRELAPQGLSLFLVVSGFCLAYPVLCRPESYRPCRFFARRCLRILPPYYASLAVMIGLGAVSGGRFAAATGPAAGWGAAAWVPSGFDDFLEHIFLIHNNFGPHAWSVSNQLWSLGLEWQWYWVFPVLLAACTRMPRATTVATIAIGVAWMPVVLSCGLSYGWLGSQFLPARLSEFVFGILAARMIAEEKPIGRWIRLLPAALLLFEIAIWPDGQLLYAVLRVSGLYCPLCGAFGAGVLLLGFRNGPWRSLLSSLPLRKLGIASYSIYLVHFPVVAKVGLAAPDRIWSVPLTVTASTAAGFAFFALVERPMLGRGVRAILEPRFMSILRWSDRIYVSPTQFLVRGRRLVQHLASASRAVVP